MPILYASFDQKFLDKTLNEWNILYIQVYRSFEWLYFLWCNQLLLQCPKTRLGYYDVTARLILLMICLVILLLFTICCMIFVICYLLFLLFVICYFSFAFCFYYFFFVLFYVIWHCLVFFFVCYLLVFICYL